jgi:predicted CXXCH cytochrome family protein
MFPSALVLRRLAFAAAVLVVALLPGCSSGNAPRPSDSARLGRAFAAAAGAAADRQPMLPSRPALLSAARRPAPVQSRSGGPLLVDDMSGTPEEPEKKADAVSGATAANESHDASACLTCHGPFEALAARTADYVTDWDEKANPHVYVPHNSTTIVECTECHDPHKIPFEQAADARKPSVQWCYSCHHAETLVNCSKCHPK